MTALSPADVATVKAAREHAAPVLAANSPDPDKYLLAAFIEDLARIIRHLDAEVAVSAAPVLPADVASRARAALAHYQRDRWTAAQPLAEALAEVLQVTGAGQ